MAGLQTIFCIEDDSDDRDFIQRVATHLNHALAFIEAVNRPQTLQVLEQAKASQALPRKVIPDINMPIEIFTSSESPNEKTYFAARGVQLITKLFDHKKYERPLQPFVHFCS